MRAVAFVLICNAAFAERLAKPIDGFYGKRLMDGAIPILAHVDVSDEALEAARERLERLLSHAPRIRRNLEALGYSLHVSGLQQQTSDLPEFRGERGSHLENGQLFDYHMIGGHFSGRSSSCTEGTLLPIVGHRLYGDDTCVHELGHVVEHDALDLQNRVRIAEAFQRSIASGHWKGEYAATNEHEWFAEITKLYFRVPVAPDFYDPRLRRGREWLCGYDADACALLRDLYNDVIDPGTPTFVDLPLLPGDAKLKSAHTSLPTRIFIRNRTALPLRISWIDFDGARDKRPQFVGKPPLAPGAERMVLTYSGHAWIAVDTDGRARCGFVSAEGDGRVDLTAACER
jgi:hypothetical protein